MFSLSLDPQMNNANTKTFAYLPKNSEPCQINLTLFLQQQNRPASAPFCLLPAPPILVLAAKPDRHFSKQTSIRLAYFLFERQDHSISRALPHKKTRVIDTQFTIPFKSCLLSSHGAGMARA
jgi:hypothetical protein